MGRWVSWQISAAKRLLRNNGKQTGVINDWMVMDKESKGDLNTIKKQICTYVECDFITKFHKCQPLATIIILLPGHA